MRSKSASYLLIAWAVSACAGAQGQRAQDPNAPGAQAGVAAQASVPWTTPNDLAPQRWLVLGPFVAEGARDVAVDTDFLTPIGGEAAARIDATTALEAGGQRQAVKAVDLGPDRSVDLKKLYGANTDFRVAYAQGVVTVDRAQVVRAIFGSDDGAAVWVNGVRSHRLVTPGRGLNPDSDQFDVPLRQGQNIVLVKVENGSGGWGFALSLLDAAGQAQARALKRRRHLESIELLSQDGDFGLGADFPKLAWKDEEAAELNFGGAQPKVRWFDPKLTEVTRPELSGRYIALIETQARDGYTHRRMLTFSKVPPTFPGDMPTPPFVEPPLIDTSVLPKLSAAQRREASRHFWRALATYFRDGEEGAIAASGLWQLGQEPPAQGEPAWLESGFIKAAEQKLALRMKLEGRTARPIAPPEVLSKPAPELRVGGEYQAGFKPGTTQRLRTLSRDWLKEDPNGFVVLVARRGVVFMHEAFGNFTRDQFFRPASIGKLIAGLTFARAVDQGLVGFDDPVGSVFPEWQHPHTAKVSFRHCFNHVAGLPGHVSHGGLFNAYLDNALFAQDAIFTRPLSRHHYNGDSYDLAGKALELITGKSMWRLLYENVQKPFGEAVIQFDLGFGERFNARYLAEVGQMLLQDGAYGRYRFYKPGFVVQLRPRPIVEHTPGFSDAKLEWGIGQQWLPDSPSGERAQGVLGPNVFGHGAASGSIFRIDPDHELVVVIGRNEHAGWGKNEQFAAAFMKTLAENLVVTPPAAPPKPAAPNVPQATPATTQAPTAAPATPPQPPTSTANPPPAPPPTPSPAAH
jgi:CubicO group peptidase (beta-lactamase class C family)